MLVCCAVLTFNIRSLVVVFGTVSRVSETLHTVNVSRVLFLLSRPVYQWLVVTLVSGVVCSPPTTVP